MLLYPFGLSDAGMAHDRGQNRFNIPNHSTYTLHNLVLRIV